MMEATDPQAVAPLAANLQLLLHGILILVGLALCFFGFRLFQLAVALAVGLLGAIACAAAGYQFGSEPLAWAAAGFFLGGLLGVLCGYLFYATGIALLGASLGAGLVFPWLAALEFWPRIGLLFLCALGAAAAAIWLSNFTLRFASAMLGAHAVMNGIWAVFLGPPPILFRDDHTVLLQWIGGHPVPFIASLALGLVGFIVQTRASRAG
jgi:hypothetical protein